MNEQEQQIVAAEVEAATPYAVKTATTLRTIYLAFKAVGFTRWQAFRLLIAHMGAPQPQPEVPPEYREWLQRQSRLMEEGLRQMREDD